MTRLLTRKEIQSILPLKNVLEIVEKAFEQHALKKTVMPVRTCIPIEKNNGIVCTMPAYIESMDALGMKVVSTFRDNPGKFGVPSVQGTILMNDSATGKVIAIMDGSYITGMRTAAATAIATKYLARKDSETLGMIGTGGQAFYQLLGQCEVAGIKKVKVYDVNVDYRNEFVKKAEKAVKSGVKIVPVDKPEEAVKGSDIVVTSTTSKKPILDGNWIEEGTHINGIGSYEPFARELDTTTMKRASKVVVDAYEAAMSEAGDIIIPIKERALPKDFVYAQLGELVAKIKPGRTDPKEITVFKTVGTAIQDVSTAIQVYKIALQKGIGLEFDFTA